MLPEFEAVEEQRRSERGGQQYGDRAAPAIEQERQPGDGGERQQRPERWQDVPAPQAEHGNERRADDREQPRCASVRMRVVDEEEPVDERGWFAPDFRKRDLSGARRRRERVPGGD